MTLLNYIDNEVPAFGEWDSIVQAGSSTIVQSADAAFPERGQTGNRSTVSANSEVAYASVVPNLEFPTGGLHFRIYFRVNNASATGRFFTLFNSHGTGVLNHRVALWYLAGGVLEFDGYKDNRLACRYVFGAPVVGRWYCLEFRVTRACTSVACDGRYTVWIDGREVYDAQNVDNYDRADMARTAHLGPCAYSSAGFITDTDELVIDDDYIGPFVPTPLTEYPEARRTVVLYREGSTDSTDFADYCVEQLGVPRCNLCPLPNATANETLASYATFQSEVETDLAAWLALNPTVAANCSCFLLGYGVPGYFEVPYSKYSAVSRLMNYGTAFLGPIDNPLYNPSTVARLTKTGLGGKYLCTRIDADTLANAKLIIDRGLAVAGTATLPATDKLYSDETAYRASLACQHLRIITDALGEFADAAFVWGDTGTPAFGAAGSRACFADDSADSADTLRATSELFDAIITNLYAAGLGFSADGCSLNAECFFEMLRIGGTLAEALAVAIAKLDFTAVAVGLPFMTVAFQLGGYNAYRHVGGVDWDDAAVVAYLRAGVSEANLAGLGHVADQTYYYGIRAVSDSGIEETGVASIVRVIVDSEGELIYPPPPRPIWAKVAAAAGGQIDLSFRYDAPSSIRYDDAVGVQVARITGGVADWDNPLNIDGASQVAVSGSVIRNNCRLDDAFDHGETVELAVRSISAQSVGGDEIRLKIVADAEGPDAVGYLEAAQI